ncbi:multiple ankyrin repeats single kh domain-containing protein [Apiospora saccharicola]|uniref:Multiple ankyrin repeats single kh domain-containing protein n=1 Tax=Apiospora saccharicola TaxID=335842 RepID=A0ABR1VDI5_9PEZI
MLLSHDADTRLQIPKKENSPFNTDSTDKESALQLGVLSGNLGIVKALLGNERDLSGYWEITKELLDSGALVDIPLYAAVNYGRVEVARELVLAGLPVSSLLFNQACEKGCLEMVEVLIERVYDGENSETVVANAFTVPGINETIASFLLEYALPTKKGISRICAEGLIRSFTMLEIEGTSLDQPDENGDYPLQMAGANFKLKMVSLLISRGAHVDCHRPKGGTPLEEIVQLLVGQGANVTENGRNCGPPLHLACFLGSNSVVQTLIRNGAKVDEAGGHFEKSIFAAVQGGHPDIVTLLLEHSPQTNQMHSEYATPLHLACANGDAACARRLLEYGADATALDSENRTPLTVALSPQYLSRIPGPNEETVVEALVKAAKHLRICDNDLVFTATHNFRSERGDLSRLLERDKDIVVSESVICRVVERSLFLDADLLSLLSRKASGIGVTDNMLNACRHAGSGQRGYGFGWTNVLGVGSQNHGRFPPPGTGDPHGEAALIALLTRAKCLRDCDDDLVAAAGLGGTHAVETLAPLLGRDIDKMVFESIICCIPEGYDIYGNDWNVLMSRTGGIGVSTNTIQACHGERERVCSSTVQ